MPTPEWPKRDDARARRFDVVCVQNVAVNPALREGINGPEASRHGRRDGGAVNVAVALTKQGLRVGLTSVFGDDEGGRALLATTAANGVDVRGVKLVPPRHGLSFVRGGALQAVSFREEEEPISVPDDWSTQVLLLSGMSPVVSHSAALCRAARVARREGAIVVVDLGASKHEWRGRDPRSIRMILREAHVVWFSAEDLADLKTDAASVRAAMARTAVLVSSNGVGCTAALGPFGELVQPPREGTAPWPRQQGQAVAAAICYELARTGQADPCDGDLWSRVLQRGHAMSAASA